MCLKKVEYMRTSFKVDVSQLANHCKPSVLLVNLEGALLMNALLAESTGR